MQRDNTFSICKAIGIILMVIYHAGGPSYFTRFAYEFIMPLFFMASGYFFNTKYLSDEATFVKKRLKGLYVPFVKWSVVFLILHNLMFTVGILSEQVGNATGGVTHPYTWHVFQQRLWNIFLSMSSYDEFLCGAYWFFRALLVASIAYLVLYKLLVAITKRWYKDNDSIAFPLSICMIAILLAAWQTAEGLRITTLVQGGYRDIMGVFFIGCGNVFRLLRSRYKVNIITTLCLLAITVGFSIYAPTGMVYNASFETFIKLPIPAICGTLAIYNISWWMDKKNIWGKQFWIFCGNNTLYILLFHFVAFKIASILKILCYGLDWKQLGAFPFIPAPPQSDGFWIVYTICGIGIPLLGIYIQKLYSAR